MDISVLVYKNHQNADMEGYDRKVLVYLIFHHSPEIFLRILKTSSIFVIKIFLIIFTPGLRVCSTSNSVRIFLSVGEYTSM